MVVVRKLDEFVATHVRETSAFIWVKRGPEDVHRTRGRLQRIPDAGDAPVQVGIVGSVPDKQDVAALQAGSELREKRVRSPVVCDRVVIGLRED